ncbi:peptidoglycan-binding protein [Siculibacillus lacustris]|uniref:Peptidoglycan-binding protein n=1 Tax=Siculibacillus lacustris TaxID=1549641 RepID=A0A4V2KUE9_9HYPH|nr:peptidoglycan-binding domain-containing protein [Siculibacillus lacustris]TBW41325.1 peptidoglycan-binding protein [Siculibacillus lacustris]
MHALILLTTDKNPWLYWNIDRQIGPGSHGEDVRFAQYLLVYWSYTFELGYEISEVDGYWGGRTSAVVRAMEQNTRWRVVRDGYISPIPEPFVHNTASNKSFKFDILLENYTRRATGFGINQLSNERVNAVMRGIPNDGYCPPALAAALRRALIGVNV